MKFRKKPTVIEAFKYNIDPRPDWFQEEVINDNVTTYPDHCRISTLGGEIWADIGDYIIKGVEGELYPCKPSIFEKTYVKVEE